MILNPREKNIARATGGALALFLTYSFVVAPFYETWEKTNQLLATARGTIEANNDTFSRQRRLKNVWTEMLAGGLKDNRNDAETQAQQGIDKLGGDVNVGVESFKNDRTTQENKFEVINFHITAKAKMASIGSMIYYMETAKIPIRINQIQFVPRSEGKDDLQIQMSISTLCVSNNANDKKTSTASTGAQP